MGAPAPLPHVRPCRLLRFLACRHATKHFHHTEHPIIRSFEPGEYWGWCYIDQLMLDFAPVPE
jgi:hypothetical protein